MMKLVGKPSHVQKPMNTLTGNQQTRYKHEQMKIGAQSSGKGELKWSYFHVPMALSAKDAPLAAEDARLATSALQSCCVCTSVL